MCNLHCCFGTFSFWPFPMSTKQKGHANEGRKKDWMGERGCTRANSIQSRIRKKRKHSFAHKQRCASEFWFYVAWKRRMVGLCVLCLFVDVDCWFVSHALFVCMRVYSPHYPWTDMKKRKRKKKADLSFNLAHTLRNLLLLPNLQRNFHSFLLFLCPLPLFFFFPRKGL